MIKIENIQTYGWEEAIRGMRNPMNSWQNSDSDFSDPEHYEIGPNDLKLMRKLAKGGPVHGKYLRMITVYMDITAPLYWWKEFDTYKVGTVANSCSTMHKIHAKEFVLEDFSHEHLGPSALQVLDETISELNYHRNRFIDTKDKVFWWQMIQLLPSSYNQKRTVMLNYEVIRGMLAYRSDHKLDEWQIFCETMKNLLPYSNLIFKEDENNDR